MASLIRTEKAWAGTCRGLLLTLADGLTASGFAQVSRSALVNVRYVQHLVPLDSGEGRVLLRSGTELPVSRRFRATFQAALRGDGA